MAKELTKEELQKELKGLACKHKALDLQMRDTGISWTDMQNIKSQALSISKDIGKMIKKLDKLGVKVERETLRRGCD